MTVTQFLLHAGHQDNGLFGYDLVPQDPVALVLIVAGLLLIVAGLYRLHTYDAGAEPVEERADA